MPADPSLTEVVFPLSTVKTAFNSAKVVGGATCFHDLSEAWKLHEVRSKKDGDAYNMCKYNDDGERKLENIVGVGGIVLDIDKVSPDVVDPLRRRAKQYKSILHTTYSHTRSKASLRLVVPLKEMICLEDYEQASRGLAHLMEVRCDNVSFNANQLYYPPSRPSGDEEHHFIDANTAGEWLNVETLPTPPKKLKTSKRSSAGDEEKQTSMFKLAEAIVAAHFPSKLKSVEGDIFIYKDGYWQTVKPYAFTRSLLDLADYASLIPNPSQAESLVRSIKIVTAIPEFPEAKPMTANVLDGILDLETGKLLPHAPDYNHRNQFPVRYAGKGQCKRWLQHLDEVFRDDEDREEKITFLQEWFGYLLIPNTDQQKMLWLVGPGANGKNVVLDVMANVLGEHNCTSMSLNEMSNEFLRSGLYGKLANLSSELQAGKRLNDAFLKSVVSGDAITANRKNATPITFRPYSRLVSAMNELPPLIDISHGFFRRLIVLTFNRTLAQEEMDRTLPAQLKVETPGIVKWAVEGLLRLREAGRFTNVPSSERLCGEYKYESDPVAMFLMEAVQTKGSSIKTEKKDVYKAYRRFCETRGYWTKSDAQFGKAMRQEGIESKSSNSKSYYVISLKPGINAADHHASAQRETLHVDDDE